MTTRRGSTRRWRKLRDRQLRREPRCTLCLEHNRVRAATEVDHIRPVRDGGAELDEQNVQSLCALCHSIKTANENVERQHGKPARIRAPADPATGFPLPGFGHPWSA